MANVFNGRWQVFDAAGTNYASLFQVAGTVTGSGPLITVDHGGGLTIEYEGTGLAHGGGLLTAGTITKVIVKKFGIGVAVLDSIAGHGFVIETAGFDFLGGAATYNQLLSGDNLIVGSPNGTPGIPELLDGGAGSDTFRPGNGNTTLNDITGVTTLDVSGLAGPTTVNLNLQTFTVGGATGTMNGVSRFIGTDAADAIIGGVDGEFDIRTGDGADSIEAFGSTLYGASFAVDAGDGDDDIFISQFGYGTIDGGAGNDTVTGGGDLRFYNFRNVETLENTFFLKVRTEQLQRVDQITDAFGPNGDQVEVELHSGGTVDFESLMAPGLSVKARALATGTNINGTDLADDLRDEYTGLIPGVFEQSTIAGNGGNDTIFNNNSVKAPLLGFNGNMADYTITGGPVNWQIVDHRPGSPDGTDALFFFSPTDVVLKFRDHTATINEQIAYKANSAVLPAQIYNGKLEFFGPDNFGYTSMLPGLDKTQNAVLTGSTVYTVNYQGGIQVVFEGTGLSTSGEFIPDGGSVTKITVLDTSIPDNPILIARLSNDVASDHLFRVPFSPDLLIGGGQLLQRLLSGNNEVVGSGNDDLIPASNGFDDYDGGDGIDTLFFGSDFASIEFTPNPEPVGGGTYAFVDLDGAASIKRTVEKAAASAEAAANGEDISKRALPDFIDELIALFGGDPHAHTFDGLDYLFHGLGEFVLTRSTVPGDPFEIQARTIPFPVVGLASVTAQAATRAGTDIVVFDASQTGVVFVNGVLADLSSGPVTLDGGVLSRTGFGSYTLDYDTGERLSVDHIVTATNFLSLAIDPGTQRAPGTLEGVLGNFDGDRTNDYQLEDGTVLSRPLSRATLYGQFADAWRIDQAESIFDYEPGETTNTFSDTTEPVSFALADVPADVLARAEALVSEAGISNQALRNNAVYDYLISGDAAYIDAYAVLEGRGIATPDFEVDSGGLAAPMLGVIAREASVIEAAAGNPTAITFEVYRAGPAVGTATVDWAVVDPGAGYFDLANFTGATTGSVMFATGEATKSFTVNLADGQVTAASERVRVEISTPGSMPILNSVGHAEVFNRGAASGDAAQAEFLKLGGAGTLAHTGDAWTLNLGTITENSTLADIRLAVINAVGPDGNDLSGMFDLAGNLQGITGASTFLKLAAGGLKGGITADIDTTKPGVFSGTLTLHASQSNDTGYSATLADDTLTISLNITDVVDIITGNASANVLTGENGVDRIYGFAGNDTLSGLGFNDLLTGGTGRDIMSGGTGLDDFDFNALSEMGKTSSTRDRILDFVHNQDDIDLRTIDAKTGIAGNQAFKLIGTQAFHDVKGELRYFKQNPTGSANDKTIIEGDVNGDGRADFQIELKGLIPLTKGDFLV